MTAPTHSTVSRANNSSSCFTGPLTFVPCPYKRDEGTEMEMEMEMEIEVKVEIASRWFWFLLPAHHYSPYRNVHLRWQKPSMGPPVTNNTALEK